MLPLHHLSLLSTVQISSRDLVVLICKEWRQSTKFKLKNNLMEEVQGMDRTIGEVGSGKNQGRRGRVQVLL